MIDNIVKSFEIWTDAQGVKSRGRVKSIDNIKLEGIACLRELILELAVRGKLVAQNQNDEPARELLKKIEKEKKRLSDEKLIGKQADFPIITDEEKPFSIPANWEWTRLGNISYQITDGAHHTPTYVTEGIPFLSVKDVSSEVIDFSQTRFISSEQHEELIKRCNPQKGDMLLTKVGTTGIPVLIETDSPFSLFVSIALIKYAKDFVYGKFLCLLIKSPLVKIQSEEGTEGIGNKNLVLRKIVLFKIVIPPLAEQKRIVAKVEELMSLCDKLESQQTRSLLTHQVLVKTLLDTLTQATDADELKPSWEKISAHFETLFCTDDSIEQLKQTVLRLALMGKLVKQDPNDEDASIVIKQVAAEKIKLIDEGKLKDEKPLPEVSDKERSFQIPNSWKWIRLGDVAILSGGFAYKSSAFIDEGENQVIRMGNIRPDFLRLNENPVFISEQYGIETSDYKIETDDILLTMTGTKDKKDYLYSLLINAQHLNEKTLYLNQRLCLVRPILIRPEFINTIIKDDRILASIFAQSTGTANQANIGITALRNWVLPLPPINEQAKILERIKELFSLCDRLSEKINKSQYIKAILSHAIVEHVVL